MHSRYLYHSKQTNQYMLGSAQNAEGALNRHVFELRHKLHRNKLLQQDWNKLQEEEFSMQVLKYVKKDEQNISRALKDLLEKWQSMMDQRYETY